MNLQEVQELGRKLLTEGMADPPIFGAKVAEFFAITFSKFDDLEPDAQAYVDDLSEKFVGIIESGLDKQPDSPHKRVLARQVAATRGKHFTTTGLLKPLSSPPELKDEVITEAEPAFLTVVQLIVDVLFDATRDSHRGASNFAAIGLLFWAVDELLVCFHLAQRKFCTQAYAHIRTVHEILDKVELFLKEPKWAEFWASASEKEILKELSPAAVRQKLGQPRHDPMYSFFSEIGTHATFRAIQGRVGKRITSKPDDLKVTIWLGGVPRMEQLVFANTFTLMTAVSVLMSAVKSFEDRLNEDEALGMLQKATDLVVAYQEKHFVKWAAEVGFDTKEMIEALKQKPTIK